MFSKIVRRVSTSSSTNLKVSHNQIPNVKIVCIGDDEVGKLSMLLTYTKNRFPKDYLPTAFDNFTNSIEFEEKTCSFSLWGTSGQEYYPHLRALSYPETDVFIVCYSVGNQQSYKNIKAKWIPEITYHCPNAAYIIVGTKIDLRDDKETIKSLNNDILTYNNGVELAHEVKSIGYVECSSLTGKGLQQVFDKIFKYIIEREIQKK